MKIFFDNDAQQVNVADERFYKSRKNPDVYWPSVTIILDAYFKGYGYNEWLKQTGFNSDEIMKKAGEQGSNVHDLIDSYLKGFPVKWLDENDKMLWTLEEWQMFCKFIEFWDKYKPEILVNEFSIVSDLLEFGGTIDLVCKIDNQIWLIDFKTSNYIHKTHELQIAAYAVAWNELNPNYKINRTAILWLKSATRGADKTGKLIQGEGWQLKEFNRHYNDAFNLFIHTQAIWKEEHPNYKPKNLTYPISFQLKNEIAKSEPKILTKVA